MSYCRFSSDNFDCDVYVYESVHGGWETHVASNKVVGDDKPVVPPFGSCTNEDWLAAHQKLMAWMSTAKREKLGLPFDGESFVDDSPEDCAARLLELRNAGYRVPQYAIDALLEEAKECS